MKQNYYLKPLTLKLQPLFNTICLFLFLLGSNYGFGQTLPTAGSNSYTICSGNLYDNGGLGGDYSNFSNGSTVLNPAIPGNVVQLTGTSNTESGYDYVYIYDGVGTGGAVLWSGSGNVTIPTVTSTAGSLTVRLTSDGSVTRSGINFSITCVTPPTIVPQTGNNTYTLCSGNLYDNGGSGSNYANGSNGYTVLNPSIPGNFIQVSGSITTEAGYDYLTIYDGVGTGGAILWGGAPHGTGTSCATFAVPLTTSTTGSLTVEFNSDGSNNCSGFNLNISCTTPPSPCTPPTAQPTALNFSSTTDTAIGGSFTAASPASDSYLVLMNTTGAPPTPAPVNTNYYTIGSTVGGATVIDNDSNTTFGATGLTASTTYYFFVYSFNGLCTGGPNYNIILPLTNNETTSAYSYCTPLTSTDEANLYIDDVQFIGTLNDENNINNGYSTITPGYQDFTSSVPNSVQAQGEGINVFVGSGTYRGHFKAWVDWNKNGVFDNAEEVYDTEGIATSSTTFGFVIPATQAIGNYILRIRFYNVYVSGIEDDYGYDFDACETFNNSGSTYEYGEAEDYAFTVVTSCDSTITSIMEGEACGTNETVGLAVTGSAGVTQFHWYANKTGGVPLATTSSGSWTTPPISTTTTYWVTADDGSCESWVREPIKAFILAPATLTFNPSTPLICGEDNPVIEIQATSDSQLDYLIDEDFEGSGLGSFTNVHYVNNTALQDAASAWQQRTSTFVPNESVWYPAISSGYGSNNFAMTTSDTGAPATHNALVSSVLDASTYSNLTLELDMYFSKYFSTIPEDITIDVSTDGGATWPTIPSTGNIVYIDDDIGFGTRFDHLTYDLSAFAGMSNLRVRIKYYADWGDGVAVDNIQLYGNSAISPLAVWVTPGVDLFTDAAGTIPYTGDPRTTIYVKPSVADLQASALWNFSATATLPNGCSASGSVTLENRTKYFVENNGSTDWNDPANWRPFGVPASNNCVIVPDTFSLVIDGASNGDALNVSIQNGGTIDIQSNGSLTSVDYVRVEPTGVFNIEDSASLLQINDVANTGLVRVTRDSQPMYRYDYTYWSSPVTLASGFSLHDLSPDTLGDKFYSWIPTVANGHGNWQLESAAVTNMIPATGYAVRAPQTYSTNPAIKTVYSAPYIGTPNNGDVSIPIAVGTDLTLGTTIGDTAVLAEDDQWNLIGNPYPSAIDIFSFLNEPGNASILDGTAYVWTHNTPLSAALPDPFYADYSLNYTSSDYASVNALGSTSTTAAATGGSAPTQYFASGQGFFVLGTANGTAVFNNSMRVRNDNADFFKTSNTNNNTSNNATNFEKHRFWLNLSNDNGAFSQILLGYAEGATLGWDRGIDGLSFGGNTVNFYSLTPVFKLTIQGKPLPFQTSDVIPLGYSAVSQGVYRIGIDHLDPLFVNQDIFLKDNLLNVVHNLKTAPYVFSTDVGTFENRFEIVYTNNTLSTNDYVLDSNEIKIVSNNSLQVISQSKTIKSIEVYNILGKRLMIYNNVDAKTISLEGLKKSNNALLLKIVFKDNTQLHKKALY